MNRSAGEYDFTYPFRYLHGRWQEYTGSASTSTPSQECSNADEDRPSTSRTDSEVQSEQPIEDSITPCPNAQINVSKTKSSYPLCQPPPSKNRFQARRRILLQLRKPNAGCRPSPFLEVFPEQSLARTLSKRRPRKQSEARTISYDNLIVYGCEKYNTNHSHAGDGGGSAKEEALDQRETMARIRQSLTGNPDTNIRAIISIRQEHWIVSVLEKGGYEFTSSDEHGVATTARWLPKVAKRRATTSLHTRSGAEQSLSQRKFKFVLVNPCSRQHPVVGYMDHQKIDIVDQYLIPDSSSLSTTPPSSSPLVSTGETGDRDSCFTFPPPNTVVDTSEHTRMLILVTGVWVALSQGWTESMKVPCNTSTTSLASQKPATEKVGLGISRANFGLESQPLSPQSVRPSRSRNFKIFKRSTPEPASMIATPILSPPLATSLKRSKTTASPRKPRSGSSSPSRQSMSTETLGSRSKESSPVRARGKSAVSTPAQIPESSDRERRPELSRSMATKHSVEAQPKGVAAQGSVTEEARMPSFQATMDESTANGRVDERPNLKASGGSKKMSRRLIGFLQKKASKGESQVAA